MSLELPAFTVAHAEPEQAPVQMALPLNGLLTVAEAPAEPAPRSTSGEGEEADEGGPPDGGDAPSPPPARRRERGRTRRRGRGSDVRVLVEVFEGDGAAGAPIGRSGPVARALGEVVVPVYVPLGATQVRFRATVERRAPVAEGSEEQAIERAERWFPESGTLEVRPPREDAPARGLAVTPPSIYEELQRRTPSPSDGAGAARALDHTLNQLAAMPGFFAQVFDRAPYTPLPDELGADGQPATRFADWQRWVVQYLTGRYYQDSPRRALQLLRAEVGYPAVARCNHLVDEICWARGLDVPNPDTVNGNGFVCNVKSIEKFLDAAGLPRDGATTSIPAAPPTVPFVHDFIRRTDRGWSIDTTFRAWSLRQARPGSVFIFGDPDHVRDVAHINVALRVRRTGAESVEFQLFDTGAIPVEPSSVPRERGRSASTATPARALLVKGKALTEEVWRTDLDGVFSAGKPCVGHAFLPEGAPRALPRVMVAPPVADIGGRGNATIRDMEGTERDDELRRQARRALAHLVILREPTAAAPFVEPDERGPGDEVRLGDGWVLTYVSRPFRLSVPLTHLIGSVAQVPDAEHHEVRWLVKLADTWAHARSGHVSRGHLAAPVIELFNDESGTARHYRPERPDLAELGVLPRLAELWPYLSPFYERDEDIKTSGWPTGTIYRRDWDERVAALVEGAPPEGFQDGITVPTA